MLEAIKSYLEKNSYMKVKDLRGCDHKKQSAEIVAQEVKVIAERFGYNLTIGSSVYHFSHALSMKAHLTKSRQEKDGRKLGHKLILQRGTFVCTEKVK